MQDTDRSLPPRRRKRKRPQPRNRREKALEGGWQSWPGVRWISPCAATIAERARAHSTEWLVFVLVLTTSLASNAIVRFGFVPGLFNGLTWINFVIHEFGHMAFQLTPEWLYVAGGTVFQLALPLGAIFMFVRQRDDAAACFAVCWLAISLVHTADYIADARTTQLDMTMSSQFWALTSGEPVRPEETGHDWEFLLTSVGLLQWDTMIGRCVHVLAGILAGLAVLTNALMCWFQIRGRQCAR